MKHLIAPLVLLLAGLVVYSQSRNPYTLEAGPVFHLSTNGHDEILRLLQQWPVLKLVLTNTASDLKIFHVLQTNWVPVETLTGKREVGIIISNTYARVMWNWKTNDYIQESVVFGQALVREPLSNFTNSYTIIQGPNITITNIPWQWHPRQHYIVTNDAGIR